MSFLNKILKKNEKKAPATKKATVKAEKKDERVEEVLLAPQNKTKKHEDPLAYRVVARPLITEKATDLTQFNKYIFVVPVNANKAEIADRIFGVYGVRPVKVNVIRKAGKKVRYGRRVGSTKSYKKAIITLAANEKIEVYEGV